MRWARRGPGVPEVIGNGVSRVSAAARRRRGRPTVRRAACDDPELLCTYRTKVSEVIGEARKDRVMWPGWRRGWMSTVGAAAAPKNITAPPHTTTPTNTTTVMTATTTAAPPPHRVNVPATEPHPWPIGGTLARNGSLGGKRARNGEDVCGDGSRGAADERVHVESFEFVAEFAGQRGQGDDSGGYPRQRRPAAVRVRPGAVGGPADG